MGPQGQRGDDIAGEDDLGGGRAIGKMNRHAVELIGEGQMRFALSPAEGGQIERGLPALRQKLLQQRKSAADRLAGRGDSPAALHRQSGFAAAAVGKGAAAAKTDDPVPLHNDLRAAGIHIAGVCVGLKPSAVSSVSVDTAASPAVS